MMHRVSLLLPALFHGAAMGQGFWLPPVPVAGPMIAMPLWHPVLAPVQVRAAFPEAAPPRRVERYYFEPSADSRPMLAPEKSPEIAAPVRAVAFPPGSVIIREYYYVNPDEGKSESTPRPRDSASVEPPKPLEMPSPSEALKGNGAAKGVESPVAGEERARVPESSTDASARHSADSSPKKDSLPQQRTYVDPASGKNPKASSPAGRALLLQVNGVYRPKSPGTVGGVQIGFVHADGEHPDAVCEVDDLGRFHTRLASGNWRVFAIEPTGGRTFLRQVNVELGENAVIHLEVR